MKTDNTKKYFLFTFIILLSINYGQAFSQNSKFNKQKWLTSSDYRYEIVKGDSFPNIDSLSFEQIINTLGEPSFQTKNQLTYCFDILKKTDKRKNCEGAFLTIDLNIIPKYRVTIFWVEKAIKK